MHLLILVSFRLWETTPSRLHCSSLSLEWVWLRWARRCSITISPMVKPSSHKVLPVRRRRRCWVTLDRNGADLFMGRWSCASESKRHLDDWDHLNHLWVRCHWIRIEYCDVRTLTLPLNATSYRKIHSIASKTAYFHRTNRSAIFSSLM